MLCGCYSSCFSCDFLVLVVVVVVAVIAVFYVAGTTRERDSATSLVSCSLYALLHSC